MKFLKSYKLFEQKEWVENIISLCKKYKIRDYQINSNGTIDVVGHVNLSNLGLIECPIPFNRINGDLDLTSNYISTFKNFPKFIDGNLYVFRNKISTFDTCKIEYIGKKFNLNYNRFNSLEGCPEANDKILVNFSNITEISDDELKLFSIVGENINGILNTPIFVLLESIKDSLDLLSTEPNRYLNIKDILLRVNEFDVIKNHNEIDIISLNQLFDYYDIKFNYDLFKERYDLYLRTKIFIFRSSITKNPYIFINI